MRRWRKWLARGVAAAVAVIAFLAVMLSTSVGHRLTLKVVELAASAQDQKIAIGTLAGSLWSDAHIDRVSISDAKGVWLDIRDIRFAWSPSALLAGRVDIDHLSIASIHVARAPLGDHSADAKRVETTRSPSLPPVALVVDALSVDRLHIAEPLAGIAAEFRIAAGFDLVDPRDGLNADVTIVQLGGAGTRAGARLGYRPQTRELSVSLDIADPKSGFLAHLLDLPRGQDIAVSVKGAGPIDQWRADWQAKANDQPFAQGLATIQQTGDHYLLDTRTEGYIAALLPQDLATLLAGKTSVAARLASDGGARHELLSLSLHTDTMRVEASGRLNVVTLAGDMRVDAHIDRQGRGPIHLGEAGNESVAFDSVRLKASLAGGDARRPVTVEFSAENAARDTMSISMLTLSALGSATSGTSLSQFRLDDIDASIRVAGVQTGTPDLDAIIGSDLTATVRGSGAADGIDISAFEAANAVFRVAGKGGLGDGKAHGDVVLTSERLDRLAPLVGSPIAGRATINSEFQVGLDSGALTVSLSGRASAEGSGTPIARLLAGETTITGQLQRAADGSVRINDVVVANPQVSAAAAGHVDTASLQADVRVSIEDLARIDDTLSGATRLHLVAAGDGTALGLNVSIDAPDMRVSGDTPLAAKVTLATRGTREEQSGKLTITGQVADQPITGQADVAGSADGRIAITDARLTSGSLRISGGVERPSDAVATGKLDLSVGNLAQFSALSGRKLAGAVAGTAIFGDPQSLVKLRLSSKKITIDGTSLEAAKLGVDVSPDGARRMTAHARTAAANFSIDANANSVEKAQHITLNSVRIEGRDKVITLARPAQVIIADGAVEFRSLQFAAGSGRIDMVGKARSDAFAIDVKAVQLPADVARLADPSLALSGRLGGTVTLRGNSENPVVKADLRWQGANYGPLVAQAIPSSDVELKTVFQNAVADANVVVTGTDGLALTLKGKVPSNAQKPIALRVDGRIPLSLANASLAGRGGRLSGHAAVAGNIGGLLSKPAANVRVALAEASFADGATGFKLNRITGDITVTDTTIRLGRIAATSAAGGNLYASGTVQLEPAHDPTSNIRFDLAAVKFDDRQLAAGEVDGAISLVGPLSSLAATGSVAIRRLDITVPNQLPKSVADLQIRHVNAPPEITGSLPSDAGEDGASPEPGIKIPLRIQLTAANRIFVKGRGLDAQLGGALRLDGTSAEPIANGGFAMERGRLSILGRQLDFKRGRITFAGSLEPQLDMEANTLADNVTITVKVTGPASKPVFKFTSAPSLPEDEVVARLLFNKSLAKLAPLQLAQLASEIDKLGGLSSGPSTLDQLKRSVGIDVLDVSTDDTGGTTVSAGSYIDDKTYIGVKQGLGGKSNSVVIDHDLTNAVKARGEVSADGTSKVGIGVEWDY